MLHTYIASLLGVSQHAPCAFIKGGSQGAQEGSITFVSILTVGRRPGEKGTEDSQDCGHGTGLEFTASETSCRHSLTSVGLCAPGSREPQELLRSLVAAHGFPGVVQTPAAA